MESNNRTIRIFTIPQQFPCGPQSSCCGPIGQSEEEIQYLSDVIKSQIGCEVEVIDVRDGSRMKHHLPVVRLLRSFGITSLPIISINDEVISVGNPIPEEAVLAIREKITQIQ